MSRTYRKRLESYTHAWGNIYHWKEWWDHVNPKYELRFGYQWVYRIDKKSRDGKPWGKPPKWFKKMKRKAERSRVNNAMRNEKYDDIPTFKHSDSWDWT